MVIGSTSMRLLLFAQVAMAAVVMPVPAQAADDTLR
jgi:hypothetical protein